MKNNIVGLKELRGNIDTYISEVKKGESFVVVRKSKPIFKMVPPDFEEQWETVVNFTKISKGGVDAKKILKALHNLNARHKKASR